MLIDEVHEFYQGCLNVDDLFKHIEVEANYVTKSADDTLRIAEFDGFLVVVSTGSYEVFETQKPGVVHK